MGAGQELKLSSARLAELAVQAGFELCGFARAEPISPQALSEWLAAGMDAEMDWMRARLAERLDLARLLPGARTVVALACNYHQTFDASTRSAIARYAWGRDYHYTLRDRLRTLRRLLLAECPGAQTYSCVDSGPLMEKVWAARAGLGYVARNGCLVTEKYGSWVVLAALVVDRELDRYAQGPAVDRCGSCNLCVRSCPTGAIEEGRVDARLCLSYQSIENRGQAPRPLRGAFQLAFGCDLCQQVCPLNRAPLPAGPGFAPRAVAWLSLREIAALTPERYAELVRGTALARAKYHGLRRNAVYALGAARDREARTLLLALCSDENELVREAARWAVEQLAEARPT